MIDGLFRSEAPRLQRYLRKQTRAGEDVGDLVQEAFLRFVGATQRSVPVRPAAFLQRIVRNLVIDHWRQAAPRHLGDVDLLTCPPSQEDGLLASEVMVAYEAVLEDLPERTRTIFLLYRVDGLRYREIAERFEISVPAVQKHVAKALAALAWTLQGEA